MPVLADKLSKALVAQGFKNVAAVDFTDLQAQPTSSAAIYRSGFQSLLSKTVLAVR